MIMDIPDFPHSLPVTLESRPLFSLVYRNSPPAVADQVFNNLFGWQEFFDYRFSRHKDFLLVFSARNNEMAFLPPFMLSGGITDPGWGAQFAVMQTEVARLCRGSGWAAVFRSFPDMYVQHLPKEQYAVYPERDSYDYIYRRSDLVNLPGQQYAPKRNLIRRFSRHYTYRYETLNRDNLHLVSRFIRRWEPDERVPALSRPAASGSRGEYRMVCRLTQHYDALRLCGGLLFVDGKEVAVTIASLVPDFAYPDGVFPTAVVHSERALVEFTGAAQMINQLFSADLPEDIVFINREEDLGIAGLRKAKMSYGPARLLGKSRIELAASRELISI